MTESPHFRAKVYEWEQRAWNLVGADFSPQLDQIEAQAALGGLWRRYRDHGEPMHWKLPKLRIEPLAVAGIASSRWHSIALDPEQARLPILQHEVSHLIWPHDWHGPRWRGLIMLMWQASFNLPIAIARQLWEQQQREAA